MKHWDRKHNELENGAYQLCSGGSSADGPGDGGGVAGGAVGGGGAAGTGVGGGSFGSGGQSGTGFGYNGMMGLADLVSEDFEDELSRISLGQLTKGVPQSKRAAKAQQAAMAYGLGLLGIPGPVALAVSAGITKGDGVFGADFGNKGNQAGTGMHLAGRKNAFDTLHRTLYGYTAPQHLGGGENGAGVLHRTQAGNAANKSELTNKLRQYFGANPTLAPHGFKAPATKAGGRGSGGGVLKTNTKKKSVPKQSNLAGLGNHLASQKGAVDIGRYTLGYGQVQKLRSSGVTKVTPTVAKEIRRTNRKERQWNQEGGGGK